MASSDAAARGNPTEYPGTIHRKAKGTLILTDSDLTFRPEGSSSSTNGSKKADASSDFPPPCRRTDRKAIQAFLSYQKACPF